MPDMEKIILDIPRSKENGEVIRAAISMFKGTEMFSLRVWYRDDNGELRPGKNGVNLPRSEFPEFERAMLELRKALTVSNVHNPYTVDTTEGGTTSPTRAAGAKE